MGSPYRRFPETEITESNHNLLFEFQFRCCFLMTGTGTNTDL